MAIKSGQVRRDFARGGEHYLEEDRLSRMRIRSRSGLGPGSTGLIRPDTDLRRDGTVRRNGERANATQEVP